MFKSLAIRKMQIETTKRYHPVDGCNQNDRK